MTIVVGTGHVTGHMTSSQVTTPHEVIQRPAAAVFHVQVQITRVLERRSKSRHQRVSGGHHDLSLCIHAVYAAAVIRLSLHLNCNRNHTICAKGSATGECPQPLTRFDTRVGLADHAHKHLLWSISRRLCTMFHVVCRLWSTFQYSSLGITMLYIIPTLAHFLAYRSQKSILSTRNSCRRLFLLLKCPSPFLT